VFSVSCRGWFDGLSGLYPKIYNHHSLVPAPGELIGWASAF